MPGPRKAEPGSISIQHFGFFVLRRPLNSTTRLSTFHKRIARSGFEEELKREFACAYLQESIRLASEELHEKMLHWLNGEIVSGRSELIRTFYKYFVRASTRCTPFGLFAGLAYGEISPITAFEYEANARPALKVAPDFRWQGQLADILFENASLRANLPVKANSSLAHVGGSYRYIERVGDNHYLSTLNNDETLKVVLSLVGGGIEYGQLIAQFSGLGYSRDEVRLFVDDLIANDVLEFVDQPTVIGTSFATRIIRRLLHTSFPGELTARLREVQKLCEMQDSDLNRLALLRDRMAQVSGPAQVRSELRVDTFFPLHQNKLSECFVQSVTDSLAELSVLNFSPERQDLASFKEAFCCKYDTQEVPLALVLDAQLGVGFKGDLGCLNPIGEADISYKTDATSDVIQASNLWWQNYLVSKYLKFVSARVKEISLSPADLQEIDGLKPKKPIASLAKSAYAFGSLFKNDAPSKSTEEMLFVLSACQGPSALNMLGRFAQGCSELKAGMTEIVAYEQQQWPEAILAELVYSPRSKVANVMTRPTLYEHEIEYLGNASVERDKVIQITDLMVSVRDGHIILRSKKWNKRVIPRLSNMHNHQHGLPVYRFLAALQSQDSSFNIGWDWGLFINSEFLPRIRYKNVVVSRATWKLRRSDFACLTSATVSARLAALEMPQHFVIAVGDNELFVDTKVPQSLDLLLNHMSKNEQTIIKEFLPDAHRSVLTNETESVHNEFVIPFKIRSEAIYPRPAVLPPCDDVLNVTEQFEPGSEWVYFKLYASEGMLDLLIRGKIARFAEELIQSGAAEKFFFIRYRDTESHLRLRFLRGKNSTFEGIVGRFRNLFAFELEHKLVCRIQLDTYQRELDRYGRDRIELCETYFSEDSLSISRFLGTAESAIPVKERLCYAIRNVMKMLDGARMEPSELPGFCANVRGKLLSELGLPLGELANWRDLTKAVIQQDRRSGNLDSLTEAKIPEKIFEGLNGAQKSNLLVSLVHMSVNRLFMSNQRYYEAVVYHLVYKMLLARAKYNPLPPNNC